MNLHDRLRGIALDAGLDPDEALEMTVIDFMRAVSERRSARVEARSEWLSKVLEHCNRAEQSMSALVRERKAVTS